MKSNSFKLTTNINHAVWMLANAIQYLTQVEHSMIDKYEWIQGAYDCISEAVHAIEKAEKEIQ